MKAYLIRRLWQSLLVLFGVSVVVFLILHLTGDPAALFVRRRPLRLAKRGDRTVLSLDLPTARQDEVDVWVRGDELWIGVRDFERRIALPASVAGLAVAETSLSEGVLEVAFEAAPAQP